MSIRIVSTVAVALVSLIAAGGALAQYNKVKDVDDAMTGKKAVEVTFTLTKTLGRFQQGQPDVRALWLATSERTIVSLEMIGLATTRYATCDDVHFVVDGKRVKSQAAAHRLPRKTVSQEIVQVELPTSSTMKLATAKHVGIRLCLDEYIVSPKSMAAVREWAKRAGPKL